MTQSPVMDFCPKCDYEINVCQCIRPRLRLVDRLLDIMRDGRWHTLRGLAHRLRIGETSVSARIRDLRKERYGRHVVDKHRNPQTKRWEYRLGIQTSLCLERGRERWARGESVMIP